MTIRTGDLLRWQSKVWLVRKIDPATQTAFVESQDHEQQILGTESDCPIVCNPTLDWPAVTLPSRKGTLDALLMPTPSGPVPLRWLLDWVKIDEFQMGGSLYLNPVFSLRYGDRLVLRLSRPGRTRLVEFPIDIPRDFQPLNDKQKVIKAREDAKAAKAATKPNLYDHLMGDE